MPRTVHAGEAAGLASIESALFDGRAMRLGHGVRIAEDIVLEREDEESSFVALGPIAQWVKDREIVLETRPSSNLQTGTIAQWGDEMIDHPFDLLYQLGFAVTVNTDNRLMSNTTLSRELFLLAEAFGYDLADLEVFQLNAATASVPVARGPRRPDHAHPAGLRAILRCRCPHFPPRRSRLGVDVDDWRAAVRAAGAALAGGGHREARLRGRDDPDDRRARSVRRDRARARPRPRPAGPGRAEGRHRGRHARDTRQLRASVQRPGERRRRARRDMRPRAQIALVAELANVFNDSTAITDLAAATSLDEVRRILGARVKIVAICGAGIGSSGILKVNAERVLGAAGDRGGRQRRSSRVASLRMRRTPRSS